MQALKALLCLTWRHKRKRCVRQLDINHLETINDI
mgnify:CR=1 FL=1